MRTGTVPHGHLSGGYHEAGSSMAGGASDFGWPPIVVSVEVPAADFDAARLSIEDRAGPAGHGYTWRQVTDTCTEPRDGLTVGWYLFDGTRWTRYSLTWAAR